MTNNDTLETLVDILIADGYDTITAYGKARDFLNEVKQYEPGEYTFYSKHEKLTFRVRSKA